MVPPTTSVTSVPSALRETNKRSRKEHTNNNNNCLQQSTCGGRRTRERQQSLGSTPLRGRRSNNACCSAISGQSLPVRGHTTQQAPAARHCCCRYELMAAVTPNGVGCAARSLLVQPRETNERRARAEQRHNAVASCQSFTILHRRSADQTDDRSVEQRADFVIR